MKAAARRRFLLISSLGTRRAGIPDVGSGGRGPAASSNLFFLLLLLRRKQFPPRSGQTFIIRSHGGGRRSPAARLPQTFRCNSLDFRRRPPSSLLISFPHFPSAIFLLFFLRPSFQLLLCRFFCCFRPLHSADANKMRENFWCRAFVAMRMWRDGRGTEVGAVTAFPISFMQESLMFFQMRAIPVS